jgi:putative transposase
MNANQACFPVATMGRVLGVSKAGYYAWRHRLPPAHAVADAALLKRIRTVHASSRQTYGAPRVHAEFRTQGKNYGRKRIARLMRDGGLVGASHRRGGPMTTQRDKEPRPAPDLVDRDFAATGPNQLWVADITYVPTMAGFLYLAAVLDAWSRKVVGWAMAGCMRCPAPPATSRSKGDISAEIRIAGKIEPVHAQAFHEGNKWDCVARGWQQPLQFLDCNY